MPEELKHLSEFSTFDDIIGQLRRMARERLLPPIRLPPSPLHRRPPAEVKSQRARDLLRQRGVHVQSPGPGDEL